MQLSRKALDSQQIIDNHVFIIYLPSFSVIISIESFVSLLLQLFIYFSFYCFNLSKYIISLPSAYKHPPVSAL